MKVKKMMYGCLLVVLIIAAVWSGAAIIESILEKQKNSDAFEVLSAAVNGGTGRNFMVGERAAGSGGAARSEKFGAGKSITPEEMLLARKERLAGYGSLKEQNPDMAGWVSIPGTKLDYPVMQTIDRPDYYLKHDFKNQKSVYGVPYADEGCDLSEGCPNVIVYGHHMKNGSMFAGLSGYTEESFYKEHPWFWFDTLSEVGLYQIIGICTASASGEDPLFSMARIQDERMYDKYIQEIKRRSFYETGVTAAWGEPLVTLMTCEYTMREGRLFVVGKKYSGDGEKYDYSKWNEMEK